MEFVFENNGANEVTPSYLLLYMLVLRVAYCTSSKY
jgi:hypothetical protein